MAKWNISVAGSELPAINSSSGKGGSWAWDLRDRYLNAHGADGKPVLKPEERKTLLTRVDADFWIENAETPIGHIVALAATPAPVKVKAPSKGKFNVITGQYDPPDAK